MVLLLFSLDPYANKLQKQVVKKNAILRSRDPQETDLKKELSNLMKSKVMTLFIIRLD